MTLTRKTEIMSDNIQLDPRARARELMRRHGRPSPAPAPAAATAENGNPVDFAEFPGYQEFCRQRDAFNTFKIRNPYFSAHEGVSGATTEVEGQQRINYSGYNYLDLSAHPRVVEASVDAVRRYGASVSASRVVSGEIALHRALEKELAEFVGMEDAVVFVSGYATNVSTLGHLFGPGDLILHDALIHNSALTGAKLSGARRIPFPHNDYAALERLLIQNRAEHRRCVIVTEGVFSMDGDIPDLPRLVDIKHRHQALLMMDEAHSLGVLGARGRGIAEHFGLSPRLIDIWMGTLSKSLASCGGVIAGSHALVANLRLNAPGGILYSVGLPPASTAAALAALHVLDEEPERVAQLRHNSQFFLARLKALGLDTGPAEGTTVAPVILGNSMDCLKVASRLFEAGIQVHPILYPAVPEEASRLRFFITCAHTEAQLDETARRTAAEVHALRQGAPR